MTARARLGPAGAAEARVRLNDLGDSLVARGRYEEAARAHRRAMAALARTDGPGHPDAANVMANLAIVLRVQRRDGEAEPLARRALKILVKVLANPTSGLLREDRMVVEAMRRRALGVLATAVRSQGRCAEAEPLCRRALALATLALGPRHREVGASWNSLGVR